MDIYLRLALCAAAGFILGGIPFAVIYGNLFGRIDIRSHGSGNAGSTNMLRVLGWGPALLTFVCDAGKGAAAVVLGSWIGGEYGMYIGGTFAVMGHILPLFSQFKGGKGVATMFGVAIFVQPLAALLAIVTFIAVVMATKYVSLGSIIAIAMWGIYANAVILIKGQPLNLYLLAFHLLMVCITLYMHRTNLHRLKTGTENKFGQKKA